MPAISGLLEAALYVDDLERSMRFYRSLFEFPILDSSPRICALAIPGQHVLLLLQRGASAKPTMTRLPPSDASGQQHIALSIPSSDSEPWERRLIEHGIAIERKMTWELGGQSLYFRDPDHHSIELATPGTWATY